ncbi:DUF2147 domain-containing protein [Bradyrhizobium sp. 2TAF24]|uniref:DUF2147 domain-containing protein n=1 Tax=Bradyrhizobium sp. 2TAF24 TaxID=3233011 RepID=UPI003F90F274
MRQAHFISAAIAAVAFATTAMAAPVPDSGYYITQDKSGIVKLEPCGSNICGVLVWGQDLKDGETDQANPNPARRSRPICGMAVLQFARSGDNASAYDPATGKTERGFAVTGDASKLVLGGSEGETWPKTSQPSPRCR